MVEERESDALHTVPVLVTVLVPVLVVSLPLMVLLMSPLMVLMVPVAVATVSVVVVVPDSEPPVEAEVPEEVVLELPTHQL